MSFLRCAASVLLLCASACLGGEDRQYALLDRQPGRLGIGAAERLETRREPGAAPATVYGHLQLSDCARERFDLLEESVTVSRAKSFQGEGLRAQWIGEPGGLPITGHFEDALSTTWSADLSPQPCSQPCVLSFELAPADQGNDVRSLGTESLTYEYELRAWLEVRGQYRSEVQELDSALGISLEEAP